MENTEREALENEWTQLKEKHKGQQFVDPVELRRIDEITSLLMTDGRSSKVNFKFVKGRNTTL